MVSYISPLPDRPARTNLGHAPPNQADPVPTEPNQAGLNQTGHIRAIPGWPRGVAVMGSTGSIGVSTLSVIAANPGKLTVAALAAGRNAALLAEQATAWRPPHLAVLDEETRSALLPLLPSGYAPEIHVGPAGYANVAALSEAAVVVSAQVGAAGLAATYAAVEAGKIVALANKESLVLAGSLIREAAWKSGAVILPVDSEHNAIFQCLAGQDMAGVAKIILTASGGPFRGKDKAFLATVTPAMALNHPNWSMGAKITVDSATLMNKGLEVIEACHLYGLGQDRVDVLVHPQSVIHSLVAYTDSGMLAQAGPPDMRIAIAHCLGWPERAASDVAPMDLTAAGCLTFEKPDVSVFPCLSLARQAFASGAAACVILNAANEIAVEAFLSGKISFTDIPGTVANALERRESAACAEPACVADIMATDQETRRKTLECLG